MLCMQQEVDDRANKLGRVVMSLGLKKDDTVALVHFNNPEFVWTYLGEFNQLH